eukprot:scaffold289114_cov31-Tisochrysis_lutea.AAC.3
MGDANGNIAVIGGREACRRPTIDVSARIYVPLRPFIVPARIRGPRAALARERHAALCSAHSGHHANTKTPT